ncbi:MAG: winged helix-turn-helix domain-containing protein, partial [Verrucomicrobiaceae bacterium]
IWDFDYIWEVYTPPAKRVRGYYALPVLAGGEVVGHVDLKADRAHRRLETVSRQVRRGHSVAPAVAELAKFLGLKRAAAR